MNEKALRAGCASRGVEVSCKEHVKIKIFISKKEILSIQKQERHCTIPYNPKEFQTFGRILFFHIGTA